MPPPTLMAVAKYGGGNVSIFPLLIGASLGTQDGSNLPIAQWAAKSSADRHENNHIEFLGKRYSIHGGDVYERNQGGDGNWGVAYSTDFTVEAGANGTESCHSGLHNMLVAGQPLMVFMYMRDDNTQEFPRAVKWDGATKTEYQNTNVPPGGSPDVSRCGVSFVFGTKLFWSTFGFASGGIGYLWSYDFFSNSWEEWRTDTDFPISDIEQREYQWDFLVHKGKLYALVRTHSTDNAHLLRLDGSTWVNPYGGTTSFAAGLWGSSEGVLLPDPNGDDLISIFQDGGTTNMYAYRHQTPEATATATDVSNPVLNNVSLASTNSFMCKYLDTRDPANPTWYVWIADGGASGTHDPWEFRGQSLAMIGADGNPTAPTGVSAGVYELSTVFDNGADRIYSAPAARPEFDGQAEQIIGGRRRFFRVFGTGADINLQQAHNADLETPDTISTLVASSVQLADAIDATGLVGNLGELAIEGLTPASGDSYLVSAIDGDGTINPGGVTAQVGQIVEWTGSAWTVAAAPSASPTGPSLEAYWKLNNNGNDSSGNSRTLTNNGTPVYTTSGLIQDAFDNNGTDVNYFTRGSGDSYLDLGGNATPWAISFWVNADALGSTVSIISKDNNGGASGWGIQIQSTGAVQWFTRDGVMNVLTGIGLITTVAGWQHVVVLNDGSFVRIYVDGNEEASVATLTFAVAAGTLVYLGRAPFGGFALDGQIDEVAVWSRFLSAVEVTALYNAGGGQELGSPDRGTHATLSSTTALIAPYTDGADDGKTVSFDGASALAGGLTGNVLNTPTNTTSQITGITPDDGVSQWSYVHDTGADSLPAGTQHTVYLDIV
jgi:hypothetical protein